MNYNQCPKCMSYEIGKGKLHGYASMMPVDKIFSNGSAILADICTNCGYILEMRVANPQKFIIKKKYL